MSCISDDGLSSRYSLHSFQLIISVSSLSILKFQAKSHCNFFCHSRSFRAYLFIRIGDSASHSEGEQKCTSTKIQVSSNMSNAKWLSEHVPLRTSKLSSNTSIMNMYLLLLELQHIFPPFLAKVYFCRNILVY